MSFRFNKLNNKGFNLFTALVSLMLISIALVLIFNMIKTEETYISVIEDQSQLSDLITVADLARADAYDLFVVDLREKWENTRSNNTFNINRELVDYNWPVFVDEMANTNFFELSFSRFFAKSLINKLKYTTNPVGYKIEVIIDKNLSDPNNENDVNKFGNIVQQMFDDCEDKVDVVNCDTDDTNCVGSFYLKLTTMNLSDENFEKLPQIIVLRYKNNEVIERPVLSRGVYKIYIPWRGFQAFRTARRIAHSEDVEKSGDPAFPGVGLTDKGLFSPKIHNTLEQARLGVCDRGTCAPRTSFFKTPNTKGFDAECTGDPSFLTLSTSTLTVDGTNIGPTNINTYGIHSESSYKSAFQELIENTVKSNLGTRISETIVYNNGLDMFGDSYGDVNIEKVNINLPSKRTKGTITSTDNYSTGSCSPSSFNINNGYNNDAGGVGLFNDNGVVKRWYEIDPTWNDAQPPTQIHTDDVGAKLKCYELDRVTLKLKFVENNVKYKVNDSANVSINIALTDSFSDFKFTPTISSLNPPLTMSNGYFNVISAGDLGTGWDPNEWTCTSYTGVNHNGCKAP